MKLVLAFFKKNGQFEATEFPDWVGPIPRVKETVVCDKGHIGTVFAVLFNFSSKEVIIKIR